MVVAEVVVGAKAVAAALTVEVKAAAEAPMVAAETAVVEVVAAEVVGLVLLEANTLPRKSPNCASRNASQPNFLILPFPLFLETHSQTADENRALQLPLLDRLDSVC